MGRYSQLRGSAELKRPSLFLAISEQDRSVISNVILLASRQSELSVKLKQQSNSWQPQQSTLSIVFSVLTKSGTDATNVASASSALDSASAGIKTIAGAILTGQTAPASARDQVGQGLQNALSALQNVTGE